MDRKESVQLDDLLIDTELLSQKIMELDLAKTEFLSDICDAVHSTMNGVIGMIDIVLDEKVSDKIKDCLYMARSSANGLVSMMHDIVDVSGLETGDMLVQCCHCSVSDVLLDVESVMDSHILEVGGGFEMALVGAIPETLYTDPVRLRQCLFDILNSTAKELASHKVTLAVYSECGADESWLHFDITNHCHDRSDDEGEYRARLDAILNREDLIYDRPKSVDLGLMVARELCNSLGGRLSVKSEFDEYLCLAMTIPFGLGGQPVNMITELNRLKPKPKALSDEGIASFQGHVLVADDDLIDQKLIATLLRTFGLNVTVVSGGSEAVTEASEGHYDLIILDMMMPDMDGSEVASRLRRQGLDIPIVTVTGSVMKVKIDACLASGCNEHLAKPVNPEPLAKVLAKYLQPNDDTSEAISGSPDAEPCTLAEAHQDV